ncbi:Nop14-like protein [Rickenella mellea]|uniref:Nop14-like protein n=1 Tax=Rickenella mellea TaxID=50990 RepID=A0A4R5XG82_9AGAM|nr:Nop14-like protein [Rickenella mellea]
MAKGSQLNQLKAEISQAGLSRQSHSGKKRKRGTSHEVDKDKKASKLLEINQKLNPFDVKVTKLKHDVGGRKIKGAVGKPTVSKQAGIEQRKRTLLKEYEAKDHSGGVVDRRFGENDPTMTPEERMLERFTKERQRASKGATFNLEDEDELTHYGQSLSNLDDFDGTGLALDDGDESDGKIDADTVKRSHFGGFEDDNDETEENPRKKSKAEVMAEIIVKSKEHKFQRQLERQQDENTRHQLDQEFEDIRSLLLTQPDPSASGSNSVPLGRLRPQAEPSHVANERKPPNDQDYDQHVRELALDKRAKPKDRTKTAEELAAEAKEALEKSERKRLKRMRGEPDDSSDEDDREGKSRKKSRGQRGGDDLNDDYDAESAPWSLGAGLGDEGSPENEETDSEDESAGESDDGGDHESAASTNDSSGEDDDRDGGKSEDLFPTRTKPAKKGHPSGVNELPFTFPCPETYEEFSTLVEGIDDHDVPTVIERIKTLHHPSLAEGNKSKLENLSKVLIDYVLHITSPPTPRFILFSTIIPHIYSLTVSYPISSAQYMISKLSMMHKNFTRGLSRGAASEESKTWPGTAELGLLYLISKIWPTSDMNHPVVSPARLLMGEYLGLGRIRNLQDISSGLFLCTLFLQFEELSKRLVPEAINFLINVVLILSPHNFEDAASLPGLFPAPDFGTPNCLRLRLKTRTGKVLDPNPPDLVKLLTCRSTEPEQDKVDLIGVSFELLAKFSEWYKGIDGFIELFNPIMDILTGIRQSKLPDGLQVKSSATQDLLRRLLKFSRQSRKPLALQAHKPIPIASYIPKFGDSSSSYLRRQDPDHERAAASKLRHQVKQERKGAMRELRKDARFLASVQQKEQQEKDQGYKDRMNKVFNSLEGERAEQKRMDKEKVKEKRRAGRK